MENQDFTTSFVVDQAPMEAFNDINNIAGWWTENVTGTSTHLNDEFSVQFWDIHYSKHKLTEVIPGEKVVWLTTDSRLSFLADMSEWNGTTISFDITKEGDKTRVRFTHHGLEPAIQCYGDCSNAWTSYIQDSLHSLIATGKGKPTLKED